MGMSKYPYIFHLSYSSVFKRYYFPIVRNVSVNHLENHWSHVHIGLSDEGDDPTRTELIMGAVKNMGESLLGPSALKTAEELEHSRLLDVHTWSEHGEVNEFINLIHKEHFSSPLSNRSAALSKTGKKHLKKVLLDLYVAWVDDPTLCIAVHLNVNRYRARSRYNKLSISKKTIEVVKTLNDLDLVHLVKGYIRREEGGKSRVSRIWPTEKLIKHFSKARFRIFEIQIHEDKEPIVLRNEKKEDIPYEDTAETNRMRGVLRAYNELLRRTHIDCSHLDQPFVLKSNGTRININQRDKFVRRIFNNSSFQQGGRFYGGWWQQIPSEDRPYIKINGMRTLEVDYSNLHAVLLYARRGIHYGEDIGGDAYDIDVPELYDRKLSRLVAKAMLLVAINADDESGAFQAARNKIREEETKDPDVIPADTKFTNNLLQKVLDQIREKHPLIEDMFLSGAGVDLQYIDSQITEKIIQHFTSLDIPVLPIHDSYVIQSDYVGDLRIAMHTAFGQLTQIPHPEDTFGNKTYDWAAIKQIGYNFELEEDDPETHGEILDEMVEEYVSQRYRDNLTLFREWLEKRY